MGMEESMEFAVKKCDEDLRASNIDSVNSGSTCIFGMIYGSRLFLSNTGDSRAILVSLQAQTDRV